MTTLTTSSDFQRVRGQQLQSALDLFGKDPDASSILVGGARSVRPYTPQVYADLVWNDWAQTFHTAALREADSGSAGATTKVILSRARDEKRIPSASEMTLLKGDVGGSMPLTVKMVQAINRAESAVNGATRNSPAGVKVLSGQGCANFWDAIAEYGINAGATRAVVTSGERWNAFFDGLTDATEKIGDAVGRAAANVARQAGRVIGAAGSGFFGELGVVDTLILVGAGFIAFKVIL